MTYPQTRQTISAQPSRNFGLTGRGLPRYARSHKSRSSTFNRPSCLAVSRLFASVPPCSVSKSVTTTPGRNVSPLHDTHATGVDDASPNAVWVPGSSWSSSRAAPKQDVRSELDEPITLCAHADTFGVSIVGTRRLAAVRTKCFRRALSNRTLRAR